MAKETGKTKTFPVYMTDDEKRYLAKAAKEDGRSLTRFMMFAAQQRAKRVIKKTIVAGTPKD